MATKVFINYRRDDTIATAGRLRDRLAREFGNDNVFMDVDNIPIGVDFTRHLDARLADCKVVISLIGPQWVNAKDRAGRRRLDDASDYVRVELTTALGRGITIIPVLVDGATMPSESELPAELAALTTRNAIEIRNTQFRWDADRFVHRLKEATGDTRTQLRLIGALLAVAGAGIAGIAVAAYQFGWFGLPRPEMRAAAGFEASQFRLNTTEAKLARCDGSPIPEPVPISFRGLANLALLKQATATASSVLQGFPDRHRAEFLNDGWYNNCRSWIPQTMPAWNEIDLGSVYEVHLVRFGSEHTSYWSDRSPSEFMIRVRENSAQDWIVVYRHRTGQTPVASTEIFSFQPQPARYLRIDFAASRDGDQIRIDELEIYGTHVK